MKSKPLVSKENSYIEEIQQKGERLESLIKLGNNIRKKERRVPISFNDFLYEASISPESVFRDIFQLFHDMVHNYVPDPEIPAYKKTSRSVGFIEYDFSRLFVEDCDTPFFVDRLFAYRFINMINSFRKGSQKNNIILFEGPPGSGKSTFVNNILQKLEQYSKLEEGTTYKVYWKLRINELGGFEKFTRKKLMNKISEDPALFDEASMGAIDLEDYPEKHLEFSCPNHDHPILMIPKHYRREFLEELIPDKEFKTKLFSEKQYEWVLMGTPCNVCNCLYNALLDETGDPLTVFSMLGARKNFVSRQLGEIISVFNPGDSVIRRPIYNPTIQHLVNDLFKHEDIRFISSYLAKTNNGVLVLMDLKENNIDRLREYHGIISDGVHKVGLAEEFINTLFLGLVNPADKKAYEDIPSFQDRIVTLEIPYILDYRTEIAIYIDKFGYEINNRFLPRVLNNFAKIILSTRMNKTSVGMRKWIKKPDLYTKHYLDANMLLLKMELYTGNVPEWLTDEDADGFNRDVRRTLHEESKTEGRSGISGRQSLIMLGKFLSLYSEKEKLTTMDMLKSFFLQEKELLKVSIPEDFIDSLVDLYDYNVLQEVKEAIYFYNEEQLTSDILDYLFAINYEPGVIKTCHYTGNKVKITEDFFKEFEILILGESSTITKRKNFRKDTHSEYVSRTLSQEIAIDGKTISETDLYKRLFTKYTQTLKESSLSPHLGNDNFRRALQDYGTPNFNSYDNRLRRDINLLISNLQSKFSYTEVGAKQISFYVLEKDLINKY